MKWWVKSVTQASLARMPCGEALNHRLQIWNGYYRRMHWAVGNNVRHLGNMACTLQKYGVGLNRSTLVEVGTGWTPTLPLGAYLLGASIHTYDHVPHLRSGNLRRLVDLYPEFLPKLATAAEIELKVLRERLRKFSASESAEVGEWLKRVGVHYHAPADAAETGLPDNSVDLYFSIAVLEHVSEQSVRRMLREAHRVLKVGGLTYHHIGLHDHLAETDPAATKINFLKFDERTWKVLGQNRIQFHNRLRRSEFTGMFEAAGFEIVECESEVDEPSLRALSHMRVDAKYHGFEPSDLATYVMTICCRKLSQRRVN